jgi:hypothetical protein
VPERRAPIVTHGARPPRAAALVAALLLAGCLSPSRVRPGAVAPRDCEGSAPVTDSVFLIGDAGDPRLPRSPEATLPLDPILANLNRDVLEQAAALGADRVAVVFLGDNVYPHGLVARSDRDRRRGERVLEAQIAAAGPARAIFLAGNHDWDIEGPKGWAYVREQNEFLAGLGGTVSMLPAGGCAGPERVDFGPHLRFVLIDPIGFGHAIQDPDRHAAACGPGTALDRYLDLAAEFDHPDGRHLVLALHHPLITAGPHGGHFTWKQHLFPLTDFVPWLWLPLPILGSVYPLSRQLGVTTTDVSNEAYQSYITAIYRATRPLVPLLFVGGHEHSLQLHRDAVGAYYAVSGAGSHNNVNRVEPMESSMFALAEPGYMRLDAHADGALGLSVLALSDGRNREAVFRHCLAQGPPAARSRP